MVEHIVSLKTYYDALPESMPLKKKIVKCIMAEKKPLTQAEIRDLADQADWGNVKRVLTELVEEGLVTKQRIGVNDYYVKVGAHNRSLTYRKGQDGDVIYFVDEFEPDMEGGKRYIRIKQAIMTGIDKFETLGKITIIKDDLQGIIDTLKAMESWNSR